jgi:hypothetical protein
LSYNLTAAYALWRKALISSELANDGKFKSLLQGQLTSATSVEQLHYATKDHHYLNLAAKLPDIKAALETLGAAVAAQEAVKDEFKACTAAIKIAIFRAKTAASSKSAKQYADVAALLSVSAAQGEDRLTKVIDACVPSLNGKNSGIAEPYRSLEENPSVREAGANVNDIRQNMEGEFQKIDQRQAANKAKADMAFTRRTLSTLFNDVNIYSVSPVFVFDLARIGTEKAGIGGVRYGPGAGLRLELASTVHFTAGYAWNTRPGLGEGHGAVFFSLGVRDLFH